MTYQEENKELRERISQYEALLEKVVSAPFSEGTIVSESVDGMCRVKRKGGDSLILPIKPADVGKPTTLPVGTKVLTSEKAVLGVMPEELIEKEEIPHFNLIEWEEIGGLKSQVQKIRDTVELPVTHGSLYKEYGISASRGIVLYGPPGCGKTMVAKAIASQMLKGTKLTKDSFIYLKGGEMLSPFVGEAEAGIKAIFDRARHNFKKTGNRSVIFIDEAEAILPRRGSRFSSDVDTTIVPTFLSEMDGFEENATFIILATNFLSQLDEAVIRPGRIDLAVEISRPTEEDAEDIFNIYLSATKTQEKSKDLAKKAAKAMMKSGRSDISGALVKNLVDKAATIAIKREVEDKKAKKGITFEDIQTALTI